MVEQRPGRTRALALLLSGRVLRCGVVDEEHNRKKSDREMSEVVRGALQRLELGAPHAGKSRFEDQGAGEYQMGEV